MVYLGSNLPGWERAVRLVAGLLLVCLALLFSTSQAMTWAALAVGAILGCTGLIGFCPMCAMVGRKPVTDSK